MELLKLGHSWVRLDMDQRIFQVFFKMISRYSKSVLEILEMNSNFEITNLTQVSTLNWVIIWLDIRGTCPTKTTSL